MTTINSSTGSISSAGLGSGLDVESIVKAMVTAEGQPIDSLKKSASALESKLSTFGTVKSYLSAFRDAAAKLANVTTWSATSSTSGDATKVAVSSTSSAVAANYSVEVTQLAKSQTIASSVYAASTEAVGAGMLRVELGRWSAAQAGFTARTDPPGVDIQVGATDTLADVRDKINAADAGVTAVILNDSAGARLVIRSADTGEENGFRITATDSDGNDNDALGLSALAYNPPAGTSATTLSTAAQDAKAKINGLDITSASNTLTEVMDGVSLTLNAETGSTPVEVKVASDTASMKTAVQGFVDSYNQLMKYLATQTKYDAGSKTAGALQGDSTANSIRSQLRAMMSQTVSSSSTFTRVSDLGFDIQQDGSIKLDSTKLDNALANVPELKKMFSATNLTDDTQSGLATQLRSLTDGLLSTDGALSSRTSGIQSSIDRNEARQEAMQLRLDAFEKRVRAQYTALDTQMAQMSSLSTYLTQQIAQMNKSSS